MELVRSNGQWCTFRVCCDGAQQVKLVIDFEPGASQIFSLKPLRKGVWETSLRLPPGEYRFCYHLYDGRVLTYLTPPDHEVDGLKAVLRVQPAELERNHHQFRGATAQRHRPLFANDRQLMFRGVPSV